MGSSADYNENEIPASTQTQGAHLNGVSATQSIADSDHVEVDISPTQTRQAPRPFPWLKWHNAFKQVLPIYLAIHLVFLILTYLAPYSPSLISRRKLSPSLHCGILGIAGIADTLHI
jgi:hypothetical protein